MAAMGPGTTLAEGQHLHVPAGALSSSHNAETFGVYDPARRWATPARPAQAREKAGRLRGRRTDPYRLGRGRSQPLSRRHSRQHRQPGLRHADRAAGEVQLEEPCAHHADTASLRLAATATPHLVRRGGGDQRRRPGCRRRHRPPEEVRLGGRRRGRDRQCDQRAVWEGQVGSRCPAWPAKCMRVSPTGFATAGTRSLITGTSFGDNLIAVLPDVIGRTVGNSLMAAWTGSGSRGRRGRRGHGRAV